MPALVIASAAALVVALTGLARCVRADGLGHRPPPPSRPGDEDGRTW